MEIKYAGCETGVPVIRVTIELPHLAEASDASLEAKHGKLRGHGGDVDSLQSVDQEVMVYHKSNP